MMQTTYEQNYLGALASTHREPAPIMPPQLSAVLTEEQKWYAYRNWPRPAPDALSLGSSWVDYCALDCKIREVLGLPMDKDFAEIANGTHRSQKAPAAKP